MNLTSAIMVFAAIVAVDQPTTTTPPSTKYKDAYQKAIKGDKPLLVLVTAQWCPPCQMLKQSTLPELEARKSFKDFHFAKVDLDSDALVARQLIESRPVPQFVIFEKQNGKWQRRYLVGYHDVAGVEKFLQPSIKSDKLRTANAESQVADSR